MILSQILKFINFYKLNGMGILLEKDLNLNLFLHIALYILNETYGYNHLIRVRFKFAVQILQCILVRKIGFIQILIYIILIIL